MNDNKDNKEFPEVKDNWPQHYFIEIKLSLKTKLWKKMDVFE
jgi:hypothetical protein